MTAFQPEALVVRARQRLPRAHGVLLEQIGVQETIIENWPSEVQAMDETPPTTEDLVGALAAWLPQRRVVAFNGPLLRHALGDKELTAAARQTAIDHIAWHGYGHALSAVLASPSLRSQGPRLVELLPPGLHRDVANAFQTVIPWPPDTQ